MIFLWTLNLRKTKADTFRSSIEVESGSKAEVLHRGFMLQRQKGSILLFEVMYYPGNIRKKK